MPKWLSYEKGLAYFSFGTFNGMHWIEWNLCNLEIEFVGQNLYIHVLTAYEPFQWVSLVFNLIYDVQLKDKCYTKESIVMFINFTTDGLCFVFISFGNWIHLFVSSFHNRLGTAATPMF